MSLLVFAAVDTGNGDTKAVRWKGPKREIECVSIPSIVNHGSPGISPATGKLAAPIYRLGGVNVTVGGAGVNQVLVHKTGNISIERKAVALEALSQLGLDGEVLAVATNLPLADAMSRDDFGVLQMDSEAIKAKCDLLTTGAVAKRGGDYPVIKKAVCQPEGFAAYLDHAIANDGTERIKAGALTAFIDVGAGTCNVGLVASGYELVDGFSTIRLGTNDILGKLAELLDYELRIKGKGKMERFEPSMLRQAMLTKKVSVLGETLHVGKIVDEATSQIAREIEQQARSLVGKHLSTLSEILLVGGGAVVLKEAFSGWPGVVVPEKPQFANARGLLKLLTYLCDHGSSVEGFRQDKTAHA